MKNATPRFSELIVDVKAWLEYVSMSGLTFTPLARDEACGDESEAGRCRDCPLRELSEGLAASWGGVRPGLVFVLAAPFTGVKKGGSPFTGKAGAQLERIIKATMAEAGLGDDEVGLTFARKCFLPRGVKAAPELLSGALHACAPFLRDEIAVLAPSVVIAMGPEAAAALTGSDDIRSARGRLHGLTGGAASGIKVMPTYGLKELLGDKALKRPIWDDILLAIKALKH